MCGTCLARVFSGGEGKQDTGRIRDCLVCGTCWQGYSRVGEGKQDTESPNSWLSCMRYVPGKGILGWARVNRTRNCRIRDCLVWGTCLAKVFSGFLKKMWVWRSRRWHVNSCITFYLQEEGGEGIEEEEGLPWIFFRTIFSKIIFFRIIFSRIIFFRIIFFRIIFSRIIFSRIIFFRIIFSRIIFFSLQDNILQDNILQDNILQGWIIFFRIIFFLVDNILF